MDTANYGHLSRQLKDVRDRLWASEVAWARWETGTLDALIPEINRLERIVNALESIGVNLDEEDIVALEWSAANDSMDARSHREYLRNEINGVISEVQERERETEQESAIEALAAAGFVMNDDDGETWTKGDERVVIEMVNGREARYRWTYELNDNATHPAYKCDSGLSGEFHRLLTLIGSGNENNASTGAETAKTEATNGR